MHHLSPCSEEKTYFYACQGMSRLGQMCIRDRYILSAVMHADEINRAMTEALGREVYHYHLHVEMCIRDRRIGDPFQRGTAPE